MTFISGVFVRIKDKNLHVECFKCATCGTSLKNQGYFNLHNKLYCDVHARLAALNSPPPNANGLMPVAFQPWVFNVCFCFYLPPSKPLTGHFCVQLCLPERGRTKRNLFSPSLHKSSAWKVSPKILQLNVKSYLSRDSFFVPLYFSSSVKAPNLKPENFIMKSVLMCFRLVPKLERLQKFSN